MGIKDTLPSYEDVTLESAEDEVQESAQIIVDEEYMNEEGE